MNYTVNKLAKLAGVSARTLRWYDEIGLLCPAQLSQSGYRIYTDTEVDRLQQILFYRALGFELSAIKATLNADDFNRLAALYTHKEALTAQLEQTRRLLLTVEKTITSIKEGTLMSDTEKFESFKQELVQKNDAAYGKEARAAYGDEAVDQANKKMMGLNAAAYTAMKEKESALLARLAAAVTEKLDPAGAQGQEIAALHKEWLCYTWASYTKAAHRGVAALYLADKRFTDYYDNGAAPGAAQFLHDAVMAFTAE